jgi:hypothetical protein
MSSDRHRRIAWFALGLAAMAVLCLGLRHQSGQVAEPGCEAAATMSGWDGSVAMEPAPRISKDAVVIYPVFSPRIAGGGDAFSGSTRVMDERFFQIHPTSPPRIFEIQEPLTRVKWETVRGKK